MPEVLNPTLTLTTVNSDTTIDVTFDVEFSEFERNLAADGMGHITLFNRRFVELWRIPKDIAESRDDDRRHPADRRGRALVRADADGDDAAHGGRRHPAQRQDELEHRSPHRPKFRGKSQA